jgi:DNA-binding NarL/FixJ family response regulator
MRVFVVEDSVALRERLSRIILSLPNVDIVGHAEAAAPAIEEIQNLKPDTVVLDIRLKQGTGIEVLEAIKATRPSPSVIVLTNYPYPQYRQRCLDAGADYFFDKSWQIDEVVATLRELSRKSRSSSLKASLNQTPPH